MSSCRLTVGAAPQGTPRLLQQRDALSLLGHLRPLATSSALISRKRLSANRIRPSTAAIAKSLMQQDLMKIQLASNLGKTPSPVYDTMRSLNPVLRA